MKLDPVKIEGLERHLLEDRAENSVGLAQIGEGERFDVL